MSESAHINHNFHEVVAALKQLSSESSRAKTQMKNLTDSTKSQTASHKAAASAVKAHTSAMSGLHGMMIRMTAILSARELWRFGKDAVEVGADLESMRKSMDFATGSVIRGNNAFRTAAMVANNYGLALLPATEGFTKLNAAVKGTKLEGNIQPLFEGISKAIAVLGLNSEKAHGTYMAFEQIISKGKVSAEELRRQLGDRIPGAFQLAARAMGVTTSELDKMIRQGKLLSEDFIPRMAKQMNEEFAGGLEEASKTTRSELNRLNNTILEIKDNLGKALAPVVRTVINVVKQFGKDLSVIIKIAKEFPIITKIATAALVTFAGAMTAAMFGIPQIIGAVAALSGIFYVLRSNALAATKEMENLAKVKESFKERGDATNDLRERYNRIKNRDFEGNFVDEMVANAKSSLIEDLKSNYSSVTEEINSAQKAYEGIVAPYGSESKIRKKLKELEESRPKGGGQGYVHSDAEYALEKKLYELKIVRNQIDEAKKRIFEGRALQGEYANMASGLGSNIDELLYGNKNKTSSDMAQVNGSGNRILNVTIGNIIENQNNEFVQGNETQNEKEKDKAVESFKQGLFSVLNELQQVQQ